MELGRCGPEHRPALEAFLRERHALRVARRGEVVDVLSHPAVVAWADGEVAGAAAHVIDGHDCELLTLHAARRLRGVGTALLTAVQGIARDAGCRRLWVVTTNDNVEALWFYQRRGFRLARLRPGAVDHARETVKPEIPRVGEHGIPLRDEIELEMALGRP